MKKFVNDPKNFVPEMLEGIALANPDTLKYVPDYNLIMRADGPSDDKVSIIQGSGSGHERTSDAVTSIGVRPQPFRWVSINAATTPSLDPRQQRHCR